MRFFLIVLMTLYSATAALAEPYIGLGIGSAFYKADLTSLDSGNIDDNATGNKLYGGFGFNKYFAVEAAL